MALTAIKGRQKGRWCDYCPPKTTRAVWRCYGWAAVSCNDHKPQLEERDARERREDHSDAQFYAGY